MAYEHFSRRDLREARPFADKALKLNPKQPLAAYVKARLYESIGDYTAAVEVLEPALDPEAPNERVIDLLGDLWMKSDKLDEAEKIYEVGRKGDPQQTRWMARLARVHMRQRDKAEERKDEAAAKAAHNKLLDDLGLIAANDADDLDIRRKLAEYHAAAGHLEEAEKWAWECLYVQVYDAPNHVTLADAFAANKKYAEAAEEYQVAIDLKVKKPNDVKVKMARALRDAGKIDAAKAILDAVLKADPEHPDAKALRDEIGAAK
jgi:cellulose synthase operon protein C